MMPAKAAVLHELHGTTSKAVNPAAQSGIPAGRPKFPANMPVALRPVFKKICRLLETRRALTEADGPLLSLYCVSYERAQRANEKLREEGEVCKYARTDNHGEVFYTEKPNYWLKVAQDAEKQMIACLDRLGLSPMNRDKVKPTGNGKPELVDPMEDFLARRPAVVKFTPPPAEMEE
jgi:P27 family predicted phage terminase small subunit